MSQATQVFNGVMFITNPFEKRVAGAFIRVDVLERRFADSIKASSKLALDRCGQYFELYEMSLLTTLRDQYAALDLTHDHVANPGCGHQANQQRYRAARFIH